MNDKLLNIFENLLISENKKDNLEYGKTGRRFKIYFDASNPEQIREKIDNQLGAVAYADLRVGDEDDELLESQYYTYLYSKILY